MSHFDILSPIIDGFSKNDWPALPGRINNKASAVLVPIICDDQWTCILTQRNHNLRAHSGEICFPGGKPDPADKNLQDTAQRETICVLLNAR